MPRGTVLASAGPRFQTRDDVTVGASVSAGLQQRVGMNRVNVVAVQGGPAGNVDRFQITKIEGPLSAALQVHNDAPTRGGTEKQVAFVTADDRRQLQESLHRTAHERLLQQVQGQLPSPDKETVVPWAGANPQLVEATFSKNADEEATSVSLTLKLRYGATVFGNEAYNTLVRQLAATSLGQSKPGFEAVPQTRASRAAGAGGGGERGGAPEREAQRHGAPAPRRRRATLPPLQPHPRRGPGLSRHAPRGRRGGGGPLARLAGAPALGGAADLGRCR